MRGLPLDGYIIFYRVKESTQIKMILIASYFFSKIELATTDIHSSHGTIQLVHRLKASCDWVIIFGDVSSIPSKNPAELSRLQDLSICMIAFPS